MKKSGISGLLLLFLLVGGLSSGLLQAGTEGVAKKKEKTVTISVPEMQCGMCEGRIEKALKKIKGVKSVEADAEANTVVVTYNTTKTTQAAIEEAIAALGYDAGEKKADSDTQSGLPACCKPGGHE